VGTGRTGEQESDCLTTMGGWDEYGKQVEQRAVGRIREVSPEGRAERISCLWAGWIVVSGGSWPV